MSNREFRHQELTRLFTLIMGPNPPRLCFIFTYNFKASMCHMLAAKGACVFQSLGISVSTEKSHELFSLETLGSRSSPNNVFDPSRPALGMLTLRSCRLDVIARIHAHDAANLARIVDSQKHIGLRDALERQRMSMPLTESDNLNILSNR